MKRILLAVLLLALAATAAPASAQVASKKSDQSPESVRGYWTAERMQNARPVASNRAGKPGGGGGSTSSWSTLAVNWASAPTTLRAHGKVFFSDGVYNYVCSGTALSSGIVWTAGHCVNEGPGDFYRNFMFVPAYNSAGERPYGTFPSTSLHTTTQWRTTQYAYGYDLGAARVTTNEFGQSLATAIGSANLRALDTTPDDVGINTQVDSYGYPAEGKYSGRTMYVCDSYVSRRDSSTTPPTYGIPCGMNGGSSGGGWVGPSGAVVSVNSYGYSSLKNTMFGPVQGAEAAALQTAAAG